MAGDAPRTVEEALAAQFAAWADAQGLPAVDAATLLAGADLTPAQRACISDFVIRWESTV